MLMKTTSLTVKVQQSTLRQNQVLHVGTFVNGLPSKGIQTFVSGIKYEGDYSSTGEYKSGKLTDKEGYYFKGEFYKGAPYNGTWYSPDGVVDSYVTNGE